MRKKVLIIDDDARNIFALCAVLKSRGYDCVTAASAQEGLDKLNNEKEIGIILMDMMMPEMDGYEAIPYIQNNVSMAGIPIIAVTAQAMVGDREKCLEAGANDYIAKPINVDILIKMLEKYIK